MLRGRIADRVVGHGAKDNMLRNSDVAQKGWRANRMSCKCCANKMSLRGLKRNWHEMHRDVAHIEKIVGQIQ